MTTATLLPPRAIAAGDETAWRRLWQGYCDFYGVTIEPSVTDVTWARMMDPQSAVKALVVELAHESGHRDVVGFTNYVLHPYTWGTGLICYLEDLFVSSAARGKGAGASLISKLIEMGKEQGWQRVYWNTHYSNETARALYDRFVPVDPFVRYVVKPDEYDASR